MRWRPTASSRASRTRADGSASACNGIPNTPSARPTDGCLRPSSRRLGLDPMTGAAAPRGERVAKLMARAGLCSRRDAERWIAEGRVSLDGHVLTSPAVTATEASDLRVDGKPIPQKEPARLWRYHKPAGLVTTHRDEKGRPTVFERLPPELPRVVSVGRLDLTSEGLLLLTNDGGLARSLELPSRGWIRRYRVRVHGAVDGGRLKALEQGLTLEGISYGAIRAELERTQGSNAWLSVSL